jgi:hypothetical protein
MPLTAAIGTKAATTVKVAKIAKEEREGRILHAFFHSTISKLFSVKAYGMGFLIGLVVTFLYGPIMPLTAAIGTKAATTVKVAKIVGLPTSRTASIAVAIVILLSISQRSARDKVNSLIKKLFIATGAVTLLVWFALGIRPAIVVTLVIIVINHMMCFFWRIIHICNITHIHRLSIIDCHH